MSICFKFKNHLFSIVPTIQRLCSADCASFFGLKLRPITVMTGPFPEGRCSPLDTLRIDASVHQSIKPTPKVPNLLTMTPLFPPHTQPLLSHHNSPSKISPMYKFLFLSANFCIITFSLAVSSLLCHHPSFSSFSRERSLYM